MLHIQPQSPEPIYRQIGDQIRRLVAGGQLTPGTVLPSVRDVAATYAINPMTVSKAYSQLEAEGVLETLPKDERYVRVGKGHWNVVFVKKRTLTEDLEVETAPAATPAPAAVEG